VTGIGPKASIESCPVRGKRRIESKTSWVDSSRCGAAGSARKWQMSAERCHHRNVYVHLRVRGSGFVNGPRKVPEDMYRSQKLEM
jgi:hypothetical protein